MSGQPLVFSVVLGVLLLALIISVFFGALSKKKGKKITGQLLPLIFTTIAISVVFFMGGGFSMKTIGWVQFGFFFLAPALVMMFISLFSLGLMGLIQSKRQESKGLFLFALINTLSAPVVGVIAWKMFGHLIS